MQDGVLKPDLMLEYPLIKVSNLGIGRANSALSLSNIINSSVNGTAYNVTNKNAHLQCA